MAHPFLQKFVFPLALAMSSLVLSGHALADKPEWAGKNKQQGKQEQRYEYSREDGNSQGKSRVRTDSRYKPQVYFNDRHRVVIKDYYSKEYRRGYCPPGLVSSKQGCVPRGQYKKWNKGSRLPAQVIYYDLPPQVVVSLGRPPAGHRYVRVASDILLITIGTGLIVDVIQGWNH